ncbi:GLU-ADT subunit B [Striga asiatica]|uniref:GLU-ADT subunit B n=1 Tax=Striga asiatica TaxID=4170 RepID=A0A5A7PU47_STRAF|nr:GLU-ADT subunit B [Striga asiatica]
MNLESLSSPTDMDPPFNYNNKVDSISRSVNDLVGVTREIEPPVLWNVFAKGHKVCRNALLMDLQHEIEFVENQEHEIQDEIRLIPFRGALHAVVVNVDMKLMGFNIVTEKNCELSMPEFERPHLTLELFDETMLALTWPMWPLALSKDGEKIFLRKGPCGMTLLPYIVWPRLIVETLISPYFWDKRKAAEESSAKEQKKNGEREQGQKGGEQDEGGMRDDFSVL